ncbi:MAG TPA: hypothetical protein VGA73_08415 [Candidatus Binatia bacterium]
MATIWLAEEGTPLHGDPVAEKPLDWCVEELGLRRLARLSRPTGNLTIGQERAGAFGGPRNYVVVGLDEGEAAVHSSEDWKSGYYLALISVEGLKNKLTKERDEDRRSHN